MYNPKFIRIKQNFHAPVIHDVEGALLAQLQAVQLAARIAPGMRVAITAGSRGIANIAEMIAVLVRQLKMWGAEPFIVPSMGSHGGATAEGQVDVLHSLRITEQNCGAPILSSMDVVQIGETKGGIPVYLDKYASEADGIILMGRIKPHTDFKSPHGIESGLMKMAAIGLGKHKQALLLHSYGVEGLQDIMPEAADVILEKAHVLCGIGIIENAYDETAHIEAIAPERIREREPQLLKLAVEWMPKLPIQQCDVLLVDEIGKNYSGTGMDTNIIGRMRIAGSPEPAVPSIRYIIACDLSEESHGNATGIGLADIMTQRLFDKIDLPATYENVLTSTFLQRGMLPIIAPNTKKSLEYALRASWGVAPERAAIVRIPNTLQLQYLDVSEAVYERIGRLDFIEKVSEAEELPWDADHYLPNFWREP